MTMREKLQDIYGDVSWLLISKRYFDKSASWLYHKLNGIDGNGKECKFTDEEKETLRNALLDLSDRIRKSAENI